MTGYALSLADLAVWGALNGIPVFKKHLKVGKEVNLARWFQHLASLETFQAACAEFDAAKNGAKKVTFYASFLRAIFIIT
jgi:glutamyl-tRNA synthetase